ncbi:MAG: hypothetical protein NTV00_16760 [Methylococcales bacterium]|nr:hypothetical protein [Methylococcales bacterium]
MKPSLYLSTTLLIVTTTSLWAAPVTLTGKNVRFIIDDSALTAFGGVKPTVQDDILIFSPPATTYRAEAVSPQTPVGFKSQGIEFKIEALKGQTLTAVTLRSSGLRNSQGKALLTNTFAYGKLNLKDQFLVNHAVSFDAVAASTISWQALNVSSDPNGTEATLNNLSTRTLDVSTSHNLRALALDKTGSASIDAQDGVSFSVLTSPVTQADRILNWAEATYMSVSAAPPFTILPTLRNGTASLTLSNNAAYQCNNAGQACTNLDGLLYRCYAEAKKCYGIKDNSVYAYSYSDQIIRTLGSAQPYLDQAIAANF